MTKAVDLGVDDVLRVVTETFGIEITTIRNGKRGPQGRFLCPVHQDNDPSADVNLATGLWSCFSCGSKGDLASLGATVLKKRRDEIVGLLKPGTPDAVLASIQRKVDKHREEGLGKREGNDPIDDRNRHPAHRYDGNPYPYMRSRGFTRETCRAWGLRYTDATTLWRFDSKEKKDVPFTIRESVCIPVKNERKRMVSWCYRRTDASPSWQPKYLYTPNFDLSATWFGLHMVEFGTDVIVCEGPMDAMWLWQCGFPALAMMGSNHQNGSKFRILEHFRSVTIFPDYDTGGHFLVERLGSLLTGRVPCRVVRYPKSVVQRTGNEKPDPQDLTLEDVRLVVDRAIPISLYRLRRGGLTKVRR